MDFEGGQNEKSIRKYVIIPANKYHAECWYKKNSILLQQIPCKSDRNIYMYAKWQVLLKIHDQKKQ